MAKYTNEQNFTFNIEGKAQIDDLTRQLEAANEIINELRTDIESLQESLGSLQEKYNFETSASGIAIMRDRLEDLERSARRASYEFSTALQNMNIDPQSLNVLGHTFEDYENRIKSGSMTINEALTDFKSTYASLIQDIYKETNGTINTDMFSSLLSTIQMLVDSVSELHSKMESIGSGGGTVGGGGTQTILDMSGAIEQLKDAASTLPEELRGSYEAITQLVEAMSKFANVDEMKIVGIKNTFAQLAAIGSGNYGTKSIKNIIDLIGKLQGGGGNFNLSMNLSGLNGINVKSGSLESLATYLPVLASVDYEALSNLGMVDLSNFNNIKVKPSALQGITELTTALEILAQNPVLQKGLLTKVSDATDITKTPSYTQIAKMSTDLNNLVDNMRTKDLAGTTIFDELTQKAEKFQQVMELLRSKDFKGSLKDALSQVFGKTDMGILTSAQRVITDVKQSLSSIDTKKLTDIRNLETSLQNVLTKNENLKGTAQYNTLLDLLNKLKGVLAECGGEAGKVDEAFQKAFGTDATGAISDINDALAAFKGATAEINPAIKAIDDYYNAAIKAVGKEGLTYDGTVWTATRGDMEATANKLNDAKQRMDELTASEQTNANVTEYLTQKTNEFAAAQSHANEEAEKRAMADETRALNEYSTAVQQSTKDLKEYGAAQYSSNQASQDAYSRMVAAAENMKAALNAWKVDPSAENVKRLSAATQEYNDVSARSKAIIEANGDAHKTFGATISDLVGKFSHLFSATRIMMAVYRTMKQMVQGAIELDSALTQLQIVTGESDAAMEKYANTLADAAQRVAVPIKDLIEATTVFARLGYTSGESATLAEFTAMLQNVGDIDAGDAQNAVTAIVKAFGIGVDQIESVMDKMVMVGNNFPISVSQIAEGMNNASSALAAAGNSFEESVALLTAANTTLQNASKASTGLRTLAARIRNTKAELDELGEEAITEAKYEEIVQMLTKYHVSLTDINGEYRSTYAIMKDIAAEWDKMTSMEQAALATQIAGTRQQTVFYSIINQFKEATGAMDAMANSAGTLTKAYDVYLDSTQAHINQFKAAFQQFGYNLIEGDVVRFFVDIGKGIINALNAVDGLIDKLGGLKTVLISIAAVIAIINIEKIIALPTMVAGAFSTLYSTLASITAGFGATTAAIGAATLSLSTFLGVAAGIGAIIGVIALVYDAATTTAEEAMENAKKSRQVYEEERQKVEALNGELQTTKSRIDDLKAKGSLNLVEQEELNRLERQNALLERQIQYRDEIAQRAAAAAAHDAAEALTKDSYFMTGAGTQGYKNNLLNQFLHGSSTDWQLDIVSYAIQQETRLTNLKKQREDLQDSLLELDEKEVDKYEAISKEIEKYDALIADQESHTAELAQTIDSLYTSLLDENGKAVAGYEDLVKRVDEYFDLIKSGEEKVADEQQKIAGFMSRPTLTNNIQKAINVAKELNGLTFDDFTSQFPDLYKAAKDAGIGVHDLVDAINSLAGTKNIEEMRRQIAEAYGGDIGQVFASGLNDATVEALYEFTKNIDTSTWSIEDWRNALHLATEVAETASNTIATSFERIKAESYAVTQAISEQGSTGSISVDTYDALIAASSDYASMLKEEGGVIRLDTEAAREMLKAKTELEIAEIDLQKAIDIAKWKENSAEIDRLTSIYDTLEDAEKAQLELLKQENNQLGLDIDRYNVMQSALYDTISAYQQWKAVQNEPEQGDMYDDTQKMLEQVREGLETGKTGTAKYQAAVEFLIPEANRDDVAGYIASLERYITEDASGVGAFLSDMISAGLMERNGDNFELVAGTTIQDICEALKITPEMAKAIFGELEEYDLHFEWDDESFNIDFTAGLTSIGEFDQAISDVDQKILDLKKQIADLVLDKDLTPEIKTEKIQEAYDQLESLNQQRDKLVNARDALISADASESTLTEMQKILNSGEDIATQVDQLAAMSMGDLGSVEAYQEVQLLYGALVNLNRLQIQDKHYTVYEHTVSKGAKAGAATAKGTKDAPGGNALVGELGRELVVSGGKFYTVGDSGAEFTSLKPGDIVFSHEDTEKIFKGLGGARGKALAEGNAYAMSNLNNSRISGGGSSSFLAQYLDTGTGNNSSTVSNVVSAAKQVVETIEEAAEATEELSDELKETLENMKKEMDEIIGNYEHGIFLLEKTGGSVESQIAVYEEMMRAVHDQANEYRALGLDDNNDYIQELQKQWWEYHDKIIDLTVDAYEQVLKERENILSLDEKHLNAAVQMGDTDEANRIAQKMIEEYRQMQEDLHAEAEYYRSLGYSDTSDEVSKLSVQWWEYEEKIADVMEAVRERIVETYELAVQQAENAITLNQNWLERAQSRGDRAGVLKYTNQIVDYYTQMQKDIHEEAEYYRSLGYSDTSDEVSKLSDLWWDYQHNITDAMSSAYESILSETNGMLDEIQNVYDTLTSAAEEYAENGGFISVDTFQELAQLGPQYMSLLRDQNGELVISEANIRAIIAAKTQQLAVDTALNYIQQISAAAADGNTVALKNLVNATNMATASTWDLVYANLANAKFEYGLSDEDYEQARRNIDAMRSLANNAVKGIEVVGVSASKSISNASKSSTDALNKQKDALDDILKYVKAMIKQEIKDQVEALKDQISAYKEIVDLQKKSLDLEKEKDDYTKSVKEKTAEIAKLQQRIYMLDLDDSREANAEKLKLQEELAKFQEDLADKQADKARDTTKDMLDDMADEYEREKNEEIDILEDSISSEEKLYQKAIERIETHWDTLYDELIAWNTQYGNVLNSEITSAWGTAKAAAEKYGSYLAALEETTKRIAEASSKVSVSSSSSYNSGGGKENGGGGNKLGEVDESYDLVKTKVASMKENSALWHTASDGDVTEKGSKKWLAEENKRLAAEVETYLREGNDDIRVERDSAGDWYIIDKKTGQKSKLYSTWHSGGIVGNRGTLKQDETFAKLQNGEMVLTAGQQKSLFRILDVQGPLFTRLGNMIEALGSSGIANRAYGDLLSSVTALGIGSGDAENMTINVSPNISISVANASDSEIERMGRRISDITIDNILDAFAKRGKIGGNRAFLKP